LFDRYVIHVNYWVKREKFRNPLTGQYEEPDERMMREVEALLGSPDKAEDIRNGLIGAIAAWAIDHPDQPLDNARVFGSQLRRLRESAFAERRVAVAKLCRDLVALLREDGSGLNDARRAAAEKALDVLIARFGYQRGSAGDAAVTLVRERFVDVYS